MKSVVLRQKFLDYFAAQGHERVASSSLIPENDPTLLFTNAGMVQFKEVFLGVQERPFRRAVSAQRCLRAGGKHNDLENVGYTARHHTFFEMLGNFSFGDYFKEEAIHFAWEFLTSAEGLRLSAEKLWVTVYATDEEAYYYWRHRIGLPPERILRIGDCPGTHYVSDNFWQMGETGPCGPCTEIFYDHGPEIVGGPPGSAEEAGDRFIEIWNCVFMQYNRDSAGDLHPLPKPCVDTGMGLERISAVLQGVHSNYEIDLFQQLIAAARRETGFPSADSPSLRVIADHIRACSFLILDGVLPSNEGRGYVLRRIIRRAVRHGYHLGQKAPFFNRLVADLVDTMGEAYPSLLARSGFIEKTLAAEEVQFSRTLEQGMQILDVELRRAEPQLSGDVAFKLYDTFGFPIDMTMDICREHQVVVDLAGFESAMEKQRVRARAASSFKLSDQLSYTGRQNLFQGYTQTCGQARVVALYTPDRRTTERLNAGEHAFVVLDQTPFYAEGGGQVGDSGVLKGEAFNFQVSDTQKLQQAVFAHIGQLKSGTLAIGDTVETMVDHARRSAIARNHSATHLLHAALREILGEGVQQKGSLVNAERTRFDFSYPNALSADQIAQIEQRVNAQIISNVEVAATQTAFKDAVAAGALALFGEKYGEEVRLLTIGNFSMELCGGTHVQRTGDLGLFKIIVEESIAAGVRRIEAVTAQQALLYVQQMEKQQSEIAALLQAPRDAIAPRIAQLQEQMRQREKDRDRLLTSLIALQSDAFLAEVRQLNGVRLLCRVLEQGDVVLLRQMLDSLKGKIGSGIIVLAASAAASANLVVGVSPDLTDRYSAVELVRYLAEQAGGKGGGRADRAQAGGIEVARLEPALASVARWIAAR